MNQLDPGCTGSSDDLFSLKLRYNTYETFANLYHPDALYNGNISVMAWQTSDNCEVKAYGYEYDQMNRLTKATYGEKGGSSTYWDINADRYKTEYSYDKNGNIATLKRYGKTGTSSYGLMDDLNYNYQSGNQSNRLAKVADYGLSTALAGVEQFVDKNTSGDDYAYDDSGNLIEDKNKDIDMVYNHLNKPTEVELSNGNKIEYIYDASGTKLRQKVFETGGSSVTKQTDYLNAFHYEDSDGAGGTESLELLFFSHEEGRVRRAGTELIHETFLKDHLGNIRVMFTDEDDNGSIDPNPIDDEVVQIDHYYPFGMRLSGASTLAAPAESNAYLYNGKELQDELGIGWHDYGARMYDASIGRWNGVDALAEEYLQISPYVYVANNPLIFVDPDGNYAEIVIKTVNTSTNTYESYTYKNEKLFDQNGKEYQGEDAYLVAVRYDLNKSKQDDPEVREVIDDLEDSKHKHYIQHPSTGSREFNGNKPLSRDDANNGIPTGSITYYDPENSFTANGDERSPQAGVIHELSHANDNDKGQNTNNEGETNNGISMKEVRAVNLENKVRVKTGDDIRETYRGKKIPEQHLDHNN